MNDILGLGKVLPIDKLIDIISQVTGRVSKPYFDKKDIDTKAYEITKLAEAKAEEMKIISNAIKKNFIGAGGIEYKENGLTVTSPKELLENKTPEIEITPVLSLEERTSERINFKESKKQLNIESITANAAEELRDEPPVTNESIDENWSTRFFNIAEDISNNDMQAIWGRILAGEIKEPNSYSLRTLEFLKNISQKEAEIFTKFAEIRIKSKEAIFIYNPNNDFLEKEFGITFTDKLLMLELGIFSTLDRLELSLEATTNNKVKHALNYGEKAIVLHRNENVPKQGIEVLFFTKIGLELSKLIPQSFNLKYTELICSKFKHPNVEIKYGDFIYLPNDRFKFFNITKYEK